MKVGELMTRKVKVCRPEDMLNTAAQLMWENDCGCLPVVSANGDGKVLGMLTDRDICMAAYTKAQRLFEMPVATAMSHRLIACLVGDDLKTVEELMHESHIRRIPVVDENYRLRGIISINDIAREFERERREGRKQVQAADVAETLAGICQTRGMEPGQRTAA